MCETCQLVSCRKSSNECDIRIFSESAPLSFLPFPHNGSVNQTISDYESYNSASVTVSYYSIPLNGVIPEELHHLRLISCGHFHVNYSCFCNMICVIL